MGLDVFLVALLLNSSYIQELTIYFSRILRASATFVKITEGVLTLSQFVLFVLVLVVYPPIYTEGGKDINRKT